MSDPEDRWAHVFSLTTFPHELPDSFDLLKNETKPCTEENRDPAGIDPTSFHKKKRSNDELSSTEKYIGEILLQASKNEVVLKRKKFTEMQNVRLEAFKAVTCFRIFPLQVSFNASSNPTFYCYTCSNM